MKVASSTGVLKGGRDGGGNVSHDYMILFGRFNVALSLTHAHEPSLRM